MNTVGEFITHASIQLNDQRHGRAFNRWGRGLLLEYLNLGLAEIGAYFPDQFNRLVSVDLVEGRVQSLPDTVEGSIVAVKSNSDKTPVSEMDKDMSDAFSAYAVCPPAVAFENGSPVYRVASYAVDRADPRAFVVEPPVPSGVVSSVLVSVDGAVPQYALTDWDEIHNIPSKYLVPLMDFIVGSANGLNSDSPSARIIHNDALSRFYKVLGINYEQESRYGSGYWKGQYGDGDKRIGAKE